MIRQEKLPPVEFCHRLGDLVKRNGNHSKQAHYRSLQLNAGCIHNAEKKQLSLQNCVNSIGYAINQSSFKLDSS